MQRSEGTDTKPVDQAQGVAARRSLRLPVTRVANGKDAIEATIELPGVQREDIELAHEARKLVVRAHRAEWAAPEGMRVLHAGIEEGDYEVVFDLPRGLAVDRIKAELRDGLLTLHLPKVLPERKTIPVSGD